MSEEAGSCEVRRMGINRETRVCRLGLIAYEPAYELQRRLHAERVQGLCTDLLLLLEHTPTFTIGKSGRVENVLVSRSQLDAEGISLFFIERGGDVTYHGPGQIVGYPIMDLNCRDKDIRRFVCDIEETLIRTLRDFLIVGERDESHPGVWVDGKEVAAIGLSIRKWVSMHGFALNVNSNLAHFAMINPCGFNDRKATSMAELLGSGLSMDSVTERLIAHYSEIFQTDVAAGPLPAEARGHEKQTSRLV
jgi:lipoate-protein ligase B